ncbi:unnamed protein product, partial [Medioppia subpectinata]
MAYRRWGSSGQLGGFHNLHIIRPPESIGRYTMIKHNHRPESPNNVRSALLRMAKRRAFRDGLGSVSMKIIFAFYILFISLIISDEERDDIQRLGSKLLFIGINA